MRNPYELSKSDAICKSCAGIGVLVFLAGILMCVLPESNLLFLGVVLFSLGLTTLSEVFVYLLDYPKIYQKFTEELLVLGLVLTVIGVHLLIDAVLLPWLCLCIIGFGELMIIFHLAISATKKD